MGYKVTHLVIPCQFHMLFLLLFWFHISCPHVTVQHFKRENLLLFPLSPGVVVFDKKQGYWLVHSTPHFPPPQDAGVFSYPDTGVVNGQNFICVTYPLDHFQTIGKVWFCRYTVQCHLLNEWVRHAGQNNIAQLVDGKRSHFNLRDTD